MEMTNAEGKKETGTWAALEKLWAAGIPIKWAGFHQGKSIPGILPSDTTINDIKHPRVGMRFSPNAQVLIVRTGAETAIIPAAAVHGMTVDLG